MKILIDENMPYARDLFNRLGEVTTAPEHSAPVTQLADVDALIVRSVTKVNESLLAGKPIKFIGTATAGIDHIDGAWLKQAGIGLSAAPDYNTITVVGYIFSSLLMFVEHDGFSLHERTVGIIGVGNIGRRLQAQLEALGIKTLLCDPPRADRGDEGDSRSLDELVQHTNVLTFHTPLFKDDSYKTLHPADERLIRSLKPGTILINACRGAVVGSTVLLTCLSENQKLSVVLNVWEGEPGLSMELLKKMDIGTPHTAGYTLEGRACSTTRVFEVHNKFTGHEQHVALDTLLPTPGFGRIILHGPLDQPALRRPVHLVYNVRHDDVPLRKVAGIPGEFDKLRRSYPKHREWSSLYMICSDASTASLLCKLDSNIVHRPAR